VSLESSPVWREHSRTLLIGSLFAVLAATGAFKAFDNPSHKHREAG
jgi:hypothetical protein